MNICIAYGMKIDIKIISHALKSMNLEINAFFKI